MYALGLLGQGSTGERFRVTGGLSQRRVQCPPGTQTLTTGKWPSGGTYADCWRAPMFAPPAVTTTTISPVIRTSVPTAVSTQVSPQISPAMAQQQASPGAQASSAPQAAPGPVSARPSTGITGEDLQRILEAQRQADEARRKFESDKRTTELETLRREMAERDRASRDIALADQKARADRAQAERFAREQAEASAAASAQAIPPPPSMTYTPSGGGILPQMPSVVPSTVPEAFAPSAPEVTITQAPTEAAIPWPLLVAAALGVVVLAGAKGKRRKRAKK